MFSSGFWGSRHFDIIILCYHSAGSVAVEEDTGYIEFEVRRSFGAFGEVSVTVATQEGTAVSTEGTFLALDTIQPIESTSAEKWYQFSVDGRPYLALASSSVSGGSMLYSWRGVFTPVQVSEAGRGLVSLGRGIHLLSITTLLC